MSPKSEYLDAQITDVRRGKGYRAKWVYAKLVSANGEILISATLPYIMQALADRLSYEEYAPFQSQFYRLPVDLQSFRDAE
jgi:hypothetical protein